MMERWLVIALLPVLSFSMSIRPPDTLTINHPDTLYVTCSDPYGSFKIQVWWENNPRGPDNKWEGTTIEGNCVKSTHHIFTGPDSGIHSGEEIGYIWVKGNSWGRATINIETDYRGKWNLKTHEQIRLSTTPFSTCGNCCYGRDGRDRNGWCELGISINTAPPPLVLVSEEPEIRTFPVLEPEISEPEISDPFPVPEDEIPEIAGPFPVVVEEPEISDPFPVPEDPPVFVEEPEISDPFPVVPDVVVHPRPQDEEEVHPVLVPIEPEEPEISDPFPVLPEIAGPFPEVAGPEIVFVPDEDVIPHIDIMPDLPEMILGPEATNELPMYKGKIQLADDQE